MKLIIGLGNPEKGYKNTRHNIGFQVIDKISSDYNIDINKVKFKAHIGEGIIDNEKVVLIKPQTFMNLSGLSIKPALDFYKLSFEDILVIYDDVNLPVGTLRLREKGSAGGQNGMKDIINRIGTDNFPRIRVGIGEKPPYFNLADFVLSKFTKDEEEKLDLVIQDASDSIRIILREGFSMAMNKYNGKK